MQLFAYITATAAIVWASNVEVTVPKQKNQATTAAPAAHLLEMSTAYDIQLHPPGYELSPLPPDTTVEQYKLTHADGKQMTCFIPKPIEESLTHIDEAEERAARIMTLLEDHQIVWHGKENDYVLTPGKNLFQSDQAIPRGQDGAPEVHAPGTHTVEGLIGQHMKFVPKSAKVAVDEDGSVILQQTYESESHEEHVDVILTCNSHKPALQETGNTVTLRIKHRICDLLPNPTDLIKSLNGVCSKIAQGWWTYEVCFGSQVRQFHGEGADSTENVLGKVEQGAEPVVRMDVKSVGERPAIVQEYLNGKPCDVKEGKPRVSTIRVECMPARNIDRRHHAAVGTHHYVAISDLQEPATCTYQFTVQYTRACLHPQLNPFSTRVMQPAASTIHCIVDSDDATPSDDDV